MANHMTAEQLRAGLVAAAEQWKRAAAAAEESGDSEVWMLCLRAAGQLNEVVARLSGMAADTWQPIETAPRDSRKILVGRFNAYGEWRTHLAWRRLPYEGAPDEQCSWCYDKDGTLLDASIHSCGATHWRPLPAAPEPPHV